VGGIHEERVFILLFGGMGFVVWIVTWLWLAQLGVDESGGSKGEKIKKGRKEK